MRSLSLACDQAGDEKRAVGIPWSEGSWHLNSGSEGLNFPDAEGGGAAGAYKLKANA